MGAFFFILTEHLGLHHTETEIWSYNQTSCLFFMSPGKCLKLILIYYFLMFYCQKLFRLFIWTLPFILFPLIPISNWVVKPLSRGQSWVFRRPLNDSGFGNNLFQNWLCIQPFLAFQKGRTGSIGSRWRHPKLKNPKSFSLQPQRPSVTAASPLNFGFTKSRTSKRTRQIISLHVNSCFSCYCLLSEILSQIMSDLSWSPKRINSKHDLLCFWIVFLT